MGFFFSGDSGSVIISYLHHEQHRVENDEEHDEVLKWRRGYKSPDMEQESRLLFWNIDLHWLGLDHIVDARFLEEVKKMEVVELGASFIV